MVDFQGKTKQLENAGEYGLGIFGRAKKKERILKAVSAFSSSSSIGIKVPVLWLWPGPRKAQQLELLDFARRRNVNTAAQIEEFALLIDRYRLAFRNRIKQFQFQIIADFGKQGSGFLSAYFFSYDRKI